MAFAPLNHRHTAVWVVGVTAISTLAVQLFGVGRPKHTSWHFFDDAARLLFDRGSTQAPGGGLDVYASHPQFQFGPLSILVAQVIRLVSFGHGTIGASLFIGALMPLILWLILDASRLANPSLPSPKLIGPIAAGIGLPIAWAYLSVYSLHLDDSLAVLFTVLALWGIAGRRDLVVGVAVGLAIASKPWAAAFLPLAFALPKGRRFRAMAVAMSLGIGLWLPFVVDAQNTITALGHFTISNAPDSALRALGVRSAATPGWDRGAQLAIGAAAGGWCVQTGRWPAALMTAAAVRIAIDPASHLYYTSSLVAFVLAWELISRRSSIPFVSLVTALALLEPRYLHFSPTLAGSIRLATCAAIVALATTVAGPPYPNLNETPCQ